MTKLPENVINFLRAYAKWDEFSRCTSLPHYWEIREENCELCRLDLRASRGAKAWRLFCSCCPVYSVTLQLSCSGISWPDADYARRNNDLPGFNEAGSDNMYIDFSELKLDTENGTDIGTVLEKLMALQKINDK